MASNRHFARIVVMQSLYEVLQRGDDLTEVIDRHLKNHEFDENNTKFIHKLGSGVIDHMKEIDEVITISAPEWPINQIAQVDLSILRLAIFELLFDDEVPPKAVINEAVELGKAYGGENTSKFVNGVLGTVFRNSGKYDEKTDSKPRPKKETKDKKE
ncbi:MAG: transcription antitermination factor NusB [Patescibacteria group bacterium]|nr:transcription antitermination factor NusB [Patescibacteria group bacterium]